MIKSDLWTHYESIIGRNSSAPKTGNEKCEWEHDSNDRGGESLDDVERISPLFFSF